MLRYLISTTGLAFTNAEYKIKIHLLKVLFINSSKTKLLDKLGV